MNRFGSLIYHQVHTNGWLADAVYSGAYPFRHVWRGLRNWKARMDHVTPEQLYEFRHLGATSTMAIGVTNICNARCVFCAYPRALANHDLKNGVMPLSLFKKIVDEWAAVGGDQIDLTHTVGDPLVDPGLLDKINYAIREAGMKQVSFTTNGILLNHNDNYKRMIEAGVGAIYISTASTNKEMYEKVYGVKHYDEMLSGVHHLLDYNRSRGEPTHIAIRFRNAEKPSEIIRSPDFIRAIQPYFSTKVRCNFTADFDDWGGLIKAGDMVGRMKLRHEHAWVDLPCQTLFSFIVRYDGSVRLCGCRFNRSDLDDMVVGNIQEQSLLEISKNAKAWKIIKGFYSGQRPDTCMGCTLYNPINRQWLKSQRQSAEAHSKNHTHHAMPQDGKIGAANV